MEKKIPNTRRKAIKGLKPGDTFIVTRNFTREDTLEFGRMTRDYNPVHFEPRFAKGKGFEDLISHGLLTGSMICEIGGQMAWLATGMSFRFNGPVYAGDTVTCRMIVTEVDDIGLAEATAKFTNQHGDLVLEADLTGQLPGSVDREILREMLLEGDPTNPLTQK